MTSYFVNSGVIGNDNNAGTSADVPWKTLAKVGSVSFNAGDTVYLTGTFREMLTMPSSGTAGNPITLSASGTAKILGSSGLSGWDQTQIPAVMADILNESFEAAGYDQPTWTETVGAGSVVDEDNADIARPTGGGDYVLKLQKVSPNFNAQAEKVLAAEKAIAYGTLWINVAADGTSNGNVINILRVRDAAYNDAIRIGLYNTGGTKQIDLQAYTNGAWVHAYYTITLGTWYQVGWKYDVTNKYYELWVNGQIVGGGALSGTYRTGTKVIDLGDMSYSITMTCYIDLFQISSTNYPTAAVSLPAGCWKAGLVDRPVATYLVGALFYEQLSGIVKRGTLKSTLASVGAEFDFFYHANGYICIYAGTDPGTRYAAVEASRLANAIAHNSKTYVTVDGLECYYQTNETILVANNWTVKNCHLHHGNLLSLALGAANAGGVKGINASNCLVQGNTIHNFPCTGIQFAAQAAASISGNMIELNTMYDNADYSIDCQVFVGGTAHTGLVIRWNTIYTSSNWDASIAASAILVKGVSGASIAAPAIYGNLIYNICGNGVQLGSYVAGVDIYNNTVYKTFAGYGGISTGIEVTATTSGTVNIRNNIVMDMDYPLYVNDKTKVTVCDYNCWFKTSGSNYAYVNPTYYGSANFATFKTDTGWEVHGLWQNPLFADKSALIFSLGPISPCLNAGTSLGLTADIEGTIIPQETAPDMGAYEKSFVFVGDTNGVTHRTIYTMEI